MGGPLPWQGQTLTHVRVQWKVGLEPASQSHCSLTDPSPTGAPRQRKMVQMKGQIKTPEKELSNKEIDNLSDAEFKTLVIRILTELNELGQK